MNASGKYYGKFRGTVFNNIDPLQLGRIQAIVPDVTGLLPSNWAMPCVPIAGRKMGVYCVPQLASGVWIEYEQGDPSYPIWVGGFWGSGLEVPGPASEGLPIDPNIVVQSALQNTFVISDLPGPTGGLKLESTTGASIIVNDTGIYINNGKGASIVMTGPTISINDGALTIT